MRKQDNESFENWWLRSLQDNFSNTPSDHEDCTRKLFSVDHAYIDALVEFFDGQRISKEQMDFCRKQRIDAINRFVKDMGSVLA